MVFTAFFVAVAVPLVRFLTLFFSFFVFFFVLVNFLSGTSHALDATL